MPHELTTDRFTFIMHVCGQDYCNNNPQVILLDQWKNIDKVLDRADMYDLLRPCTDKNGKTFALSIEFFGTLTLSLDSLFRIPKYTKLDSAKSIAGVVSGLTFPVRQKKNVQ